MAHIHISSSLLEKWPDTRLWCIESLLSVHENSNALWERIEEYSQSLREKMEIKDIAVQPAIRASRKAYKAFGKDPARYRLSAEALMRRVLKGDSLYRVNNVVDLVNLCSLMTGYSIGGYDLDKIHGTISLGIGEAGEPYQAIGRGSLNIENLPVFRDEQGAIGSPTSDSVRTSVTAATKRFLMIYFDFLNQQEPGEVVSETKELLEKYANGSMFMSKIICR